MDCYIPLDSTIPAGDTAALSESHGKRQFVVFDEQLQIVLAATSGAPLHLQQFKVWINDSVMLDDDGALFEGVPGAPGRWAIRPHVCADRLFRSTVVMNNGLQNTIRFQFKYSEVKGSEDVQEDTEEPALDDSDEYLPSFEPIYYWSDETAGGPRKPPSISEADETGTLHKERIPMQREDSVRITPLNDSQAQSPLDSAKASPVHTLTVEFPIFSLLNMRLRNTALTKQQHIVSSLDFQTSKAATQLSTKLNGSDSNGHPLEIQFDEVRYELLDRNSHITLAPMVPLAIPFTAHTHDSFCICYRLPLLDPSAPNTSPHRVRIKLRYRVRLPREGDITVPCIELPVLTSWETDVTVKRPASNTLSRVASTSVLSTPKLFSASKRLTSAATASALLLGSGSVYGSNSNFLQGSAHSVVASKLDDVKFRFLNHKVRVRKGEKFHMRLQIVNSSQSVLDLVVYYNNNKNTSLAMGGASATLPSAPGSLASLPPTKQYQIYRKYTKVTEGIILLSNDYKVPLIQPKETYFVDLSFIAIISGYFATLSALKVLDLQTNEVIEVGLGASILVE